jgi:hypothetical protein
LIAAPQMVEYSYRFLVILSSWFCWSLLCAHCFFYRPLNDVLQLVPPEVLLVLAVDDPKVPEITFCNFIPMILLDFKSHPPTYW